MTSTDTVAPTPTHEYPADEWLRHIEFPDLADTGTDSPVHACTQQVLFNGRRAEVSIMREPIVVSAQ